MPRHDSAALPVPHSQRLLLVNPTKFLGNLLLAGGLIQQFHRHCEERGQSLLVVVDESFRELLAGALPESSLLFYPRRAISRGGLSAARHYLSCLRRIRDWRADLAFNIEEDSVSHRLTQLSGARFKLGCSPARHRRGYDRVLPVDFVNRPAGRRHRWYSFQDVFRALGLPDSEPGYLRLCPPPLAAKGLHERLGQLGLDLDSPLAVLHAGGTKAYKKWPPEGFAELARRLSEHGVQPVLIGAGDGDRTANARVAALLAGETGIVDLCDRLSLAELAAFLPRAAVMVGNDSGPFHLARALGVPGAVLFGPTDLEIWRPLGNDTQVIKGPAPCASDCTRHHCRLDYRCLKSITAPLIMERIQGYLAPNNEGVTRTTP